MNHTYKNLHIFTVIIALLILFWGLGSVELVSLNEGRRALAIKEMFKSGNWLLPTLNGELYITKPPFLYWISLLISKLNGNLSEWTLRLPSAMAAGAVLWMTYRFAAARFGIRTALFSVQLLVANLGFAMLARRAEIEMLLTALCVGALFAAIQYINRPEKRSFIYLSYFLLGLAVLTKGPVALLFVTLPLLIAAIWTKDTVIRSVLLAGKAWLLFLVVASSWYLIVSLELGFDIWTAIAQRDMLAKMQAEESAKPLLSYVGWILVDFLLLVPLLLIKPRALFKSLTERLDSRVLLISIVLPLLVFSFIANKHAKYMLPVYPLIAVVIAVQLDSLYQNAGIILKRLMITLSLLLPLSIAGFYMFGESRYFSYRTSAFEKFQQWEKTITVSQLYVFGKTDSRIIYYTQKPIQQLDVLKLEKLVNEGAAILVMVEDDEATVIRQKSACEVISFKPYLKQKKSLLIFGFGEFCKNIKPHDT